MSTRFRPLFALSLLCLAASAAAVELPANLPKRKAGLWEMQMGMAGGQSDHEGVPGRGDRQGDVPDGRADERLDVQQVLARR